MNWYYAVAAERKGPVNQTEFDRLVQEGSITAATLVWHEGMADWSAFGAVNPPPITAAPASSVVCSGCRGTFAREDVVSLGGSAYCAACKPAAVQRMQEGLAPDVGGAEAIRNAHLKHEASIKSVGILYYLGGTFLILAGLGGVVVAFAPGSGQSGVGILVSLLFLLLAVCQFIVGRGLRQLRPWARTPTAILSGIGLLGFPLGTLINGYIMYLVLSDKGRKIMSEDYARVVEQTPHIKYKTSIVVWIFLGLLLLLIVVALIGAFASKR